MSERKVIQVSQAAADNGYVLIALCDDGTMWWKPCTTGRSWDQIAPVPQPEQSVDVPRDEMWRNIEAARQGDA